MLKLISNMRHLCELNGPTKVNSERGVILPLLAFIAFGLFAFFMILGVDAYMVKYAGLALRASANDICGRLAEQRLSDYRQVAKTFVNELKILNPAGQENFGIGGTVQAVSAHLIMPTMPDDFVIPAGFTDTSTQSSNSPHVPGTIAICSGAMAMESECLSGFCKDDPTRCGFSGDFYPNTHELGGPNPQTIGDKYPATLAHSLVNAGNTVGCEFKARVNTFWARMGMPGTREINARAVFWRPTVGAGSAPPGTSTFNYTPTTGGSAPSIPFAGLSIAVATEMTTYATPGGRFTGLLSTLGDFNSLNVSSPFSGSSFGHQYPPLADTVATIPGPTGSDLTEMQVACGNGAVLVRNTYLATIAELAARDGHLRNNTEIISINPQYRGVSDACSSPRSINYPSLIVPFGADLTGGPQLNKQFQLPYMFFNGGFYDRNTSTKTIPLEFGAPVGDGYNLTDGYTNPFANTAGSAPYGQSNLGQSAQTIQYNALLAGQNRFCYSLYRSRPVGAKLKRFDLLGLDQLSDSYFNPDSLIFNGDLGIAQIQGADGWDQYCPWQSGLAWSNPPILSYPWQSLPANCGTPTSPRWLSAAEVLATMGTTQQCPYPINTGIDFDSTLAGPDPCVKPPENPSMPTACAGASPPFGLTELGSFDLRADLLGALSYMAKQTIEPMPPAGAATTPGLAILPPGLFQVDADPTESVVPTWVGLNDYRYPLKIGSISPYTQTYNTNSSILIALHQRINTIHTIAPGSFETGNRATGDPNACSRPCGCNLGTGLSTDSSEYCRVKCLVDSDYFQQGPSNQRIPKRRITVVYIPTNFLDADPVAIENLTCAFNATRDETDFQHNFLRVLSPNWDPIFALSANGGDPSCTGSGLVLGNQDNCFAAYWNFLLAPPTGTNFPDHNPVGLALKDFHDRITLKSILF